MKWYYLMNDTEGYQPIETDPVLAAYMPTLMGDRLIRALEVFINDHRTMVNE